MAATMLYNFGAALLRAVGDTQRPLFYLFFAGIVNVVLNLFFVIVMKLDVAGVALATVISQCISAALVVRCLMKEQGAIHLDLHSLGFDKIKLRQILPGGPACRCTGHSLFPFQRGDPGLHQRLRRDGHGRKFRRQQH